MMNRRKYLLAMAAALALCSDAIRRRCTHADDFGAMYGDCDSIFRLSQQLLSTHRSTARLWQSDYCNGAKAAEDHL